MSRKRHWSDPGHAIWIPINLIIIFIGLYAFLKLNATNFDITEWASILEVLGSVGVWKGIEYYITHRKGNRNNGNET